MGRLLRTVLWLAAGLALAFAALWVVAPPERVDTDVAFDGTAIPDDLDGWLAEREAGVPDLHPDNAKTVVWAGRPGRRTDLALVYVHGFSATLWETRPLADRIASDLGANLFYTRLTGHGRDGPAMAEATASAWIADMAEAMAVARRLGDRVVVIGTSTGGTLTAILALDPALADAREDLAGIVLISPNFRPSNPAAPLLSMPGASVAMPMAMGDTRTFLPRNAEHARRWTTSYPTVALLPMQAAVDHAASLDPGATDMPALFYFSPADAIIDTAVTEAVAARWGGATTVARIDLPPGDDPDAHVIAGDVLSPSHTPEAIGAIGQWIGGL